MCQTAGLRSKTPSTAIARGLRSAAWKTSPCAAAAGSGRRGRRARRRRRASGPRKTTTAFTSSAAAPPPPAGDRSSRPCRPSPRAPARPSGRRGPGHVEAASGRPGSRGSRRRRGSGRARARRRRRCCRRAHADGREGAARRLLRGGGRGSRSRGHRGRASRPAARRPGCPRSASAGSARPPSAPGERDGAVEMAAAARGRGQPPHRVDKTVHDLQARDEEAPRSSGPRRRRRRRRPRMPRAAAGSEVVDRGQVDPARRPALVAGALLPEVKASLHDLAERGSRPPGCCPPRGRCRFAGSSRFLGRRHPSRGAPTRTAQIRSP